MHISFGKAILYLCLEFGFECIGVETDNGGLCGIIVGWVEVRGAVAGSECC